VAKRTSGSDSSVPTQSDLPTGTPPRELFPTSDIRFVMVEVGKLTAHVERLIEDVKSQSTKLDALAHQASFIKGGIAVSTFFLTAIIAVASYILSSKWNDLLAAIKVVAPK